MYVLIEYEINRKMATLIILAVRWPTNSVIFTHFLKIYGRSTQNHLLKEQPK